MIDHPLQVGWVEAEVGLDRRDRHVHDREVEDDHELGAAHQGENDSRVEARRRALCCSSGVLTPRPRSTDRAGDVTSVARRSVLGAGGVDIGMSTTTHRSSAGSRERLATDATLLRALHQIGDPLVLVNVWDAESARRVERSGGRAVATSTGQLPPRSGWPTAIRRRPPPPSMRSVASPRPWRCRWPPISSPAMASPQTSSSTGCSPLKGSA